MPQHHVFTDQPIITRTAKEPSERARLHRALQRWGHLASRDYTWIRYFDAKTANRRRRRAEQAHRRRAL